MKKLKSLLITLVLVALLVPTLSFGAVFTDSVALSGGWKWSPWFGYYHDENISWTGSEGWVYHLQHGWLYVIEEPGNGMYLWSETLGWWWTNSTIYANVYRFDKGFWYWYLPDSTNPRWFYNYQLAQWETVGVVNGGVAFASGPQAVENRAEIGSGGGQLAITSGALAGVSVNLPPGALLSTTPVQLLSNSGTYTPVAGTPGPVLNLDTGSMREFTTPVEITVPFTNQSTSVLVPYHIDGDGQLQPCQVVGVDSTNQTMTFSTFHASLFTWIEQLLSGLPDASDTNYRPDPNGFAVVNNGSVYNPGGECFGMSTFAQWMYRTKGTALYPTFMEDIPVPTGGTVKGQNIIATRTHTSVGQMWNTYLPQVQANQGLTAAQRLASIKNVLVNTGNPTVLYLYNAGGGGTHAVQAFAYSGNNLSINDPNHPGATQPHAYNPATNSWNNYGGYAETALIGTGTFVKESFNNIYGDAIGGFSGNGAAQVNPTSHFNGESLAERNINFSGTVLSGQVLVTKLDVTVNQVNLFTTNVAESGAFSVPLSIFTGENKITFKTYGRNLAGAEIEVPNTQLTPFILQGTSDVAAILVTLTWNTNDTDLDLYVIDPTGDFSAYYHMRTQDGGDLDFDDTTGYGPEHWTLKFSNTVRWNQDYTVRVHYYSDHQSGETTIPSAWAVNIVTNEETPQATSTSYSGVLAYDSSDNYNPADSGADWADVAVVRPVQPTATLSAGQSVVDRTLGGLPVIRVAVPDPAQANAAKQAAEAAGDEGRWR